ncbi:MAG: hypothetical protein WBA09_00390, partial [Candidatus Acidiferrum sp.]
MPEENLNSLSARIQRTDQVLNNASLFNPLLKFRAKTAHPVARLNSLKHARRPGRGDLPPERERWFRPSQPTRAAVLDSLTTQPSFSCTMRWPY